MNEYETIKKWVNSFDEKIYYKTKLPTKKKLYEIVIKQEEEIERLNKENTILRQNSQYLIKQKDELEEVINKAIEFIENTRHTTSMTLEEMCDLEDILKGDDKE